MLLTCQVAFLEALWVFSTCSRLKSSTRELLLSIGMREFWTDWWLQCRQALSRARVDAYLGDGVGCIDTEAYKKYKAIPVFLVRMPAL